MFCYFSMNLIILKLETNYKRAKREAPEISCLYLKSISMDFFVFLDILDDIIVLFFQLIQVKNIGNLDGVPLYNIEFVYN